MVRNAGVALALEAMAAGFYYINVEISVINSYFLSCCPNFVWIISFFFSFFFLGGPKQTVGKMIVFALRNP